MEKFENNHDTESASKESIEKQEVIDFANTIKTKVIDIFPFKSEQEKNNLLSEFDGVLQMIERGDNLDSIIKEVRLTLAALDNSHTCLYENKKTGRDKMIGSIFYKASKFWISYESEVYEVRSIDGSPIDELVREKAKEIGGGTGTWKTIWAIHELSEIEKSKETTIDVVDKTGSLANISKSEFEGSIEYKKQKRAIKSELLPEGIAVLRVATWSKDFKSGGKNIEQLIDEEVKKISESHSIVIDVRGNSGGSSKVSERLARHFIDKEVAYCEIYARHPENGEFITEKTTVEPIGDFADKSVVILTDGQCLSSNEMFILMLKDTGHAITIGETTGGGSGNPMYYDLKLGDRSFGLRVSSWRMMRNNGQPLEGIGIEPDIKVNISPEDVYKNKDVVFWKALEYLRNK